MAVEGSRRAALAWRAWPIFHDPRRLVLYALVVDAVVAVSVGLAFHSSSAVTLRQGLVFLLLGVLALAYEEGSRRTGRLQIRLSTELKRDMTSVWSVAATVALMPTLAIGLQTLIFGYVWFRQERPAGEALYRKITSRSTAILGCLFASIAMRAALKHWDLPWTLRGFVAVAIVIVVLALVNRALVSVALILLGARGRQLVGSADDNLIELATLCLGGLVSLAAVYQPWLCLLVLPPMVSLQRGSLMRELETVATTDAKTGLLNAVALDHVGQREVSRAERESTPLSVLLIDIDRFKLVNDSYGHLVGDAVLRGVGSALSETLREYDTLGRFGGEEFVAILPGTAQREGLAVAERLRAAVESVCMADLDPRIMPNEGSPLSVSVGVACLGANGLTMSDLLFAADTALYLAKAGGRNRVVLAEPGTGGLSRDSLSV